MIITGTSLLLNDDDGGFTGVAPDAPTNFDATTDENCQITFTWTDSTVGDPIPTYNLYINGEVTPTAENITSPYVMTPTIASDTYYIKAINSVLPQGIDSNTDVGTAIDTRPIAFTLSGTTNEVGQITFTWLEGGTTYQLYKDGFLTESAITSPYVYTVNPDESNMYFVRATNSCGDTDSDTINAYSTEIPTLPNVIAAGDYIYMTVLTEDSDTFTRSNWHILVNGIEDTSGSVYKLAGAGNTLRIGQFKYIYAGETVTISHDVQEGTIAAFTATTVTNYSTLTNGVIIPPIYEMTEPLNQISTYFYLDNSSSSGEVYDGRLEHSSRSVDGIEGDAWEPSSAQYKQLGWIDLDVNGNATRQINTQWTPQSNSQWSMTSIYDVVPDIRYSAYTLNYYFNSPDWALDIYLWSNTADVPLDPTYEAVPYTPQSTPWIIQATPPDIIIVDNITYEMDNFYGHGDDNTSTASAVPIMTSATTPIGYTITESGSYSSSYAGWKAFTEPDTTDIWLTPYQVTSGWIQCKFDTAIIINKYVIQSADQSRFEAPKTWSLQASNTGAFSGEQKTLDRQTEQTDWGYDEERVYTFSSNTEYTYFRLVVTENNGIDTFIRIGHIKLIEAQ